jgi:5-methylcytosine-specific restriction endonuclease McrA
MTDSQQLKKKAPKPFNEDAVLRGAWRRAFRQFPVKKEVLEEGIRRVPRFNQDGSRAKIDSKEAHCQVCNKWVKMSVGGKNNLDVDHIIPVIDVTDISGKVQDWNTYKARLVCEKSNLQRICKPCHEIKTGKERDFRQTLKDKRDMDVLEEQMTYSKSINEEKALKKKLTRFLNKDKPAETRARAEKLKQFIIDRLTKED